MFKRCDFGSYGRGSLDGFAVISFYDPPSQRGGDYAPIDFGGVCENVFMIEELDLDPGALKGFGLTFDTYLACSDELAKFITGCDK